MLLAACRRCISVLTTVNEGGREQRCFVGSGRPRASQINGCAYCIHIHTCEARARGETEERLYLINAWRESPLYSARERAALAWTEAVTLVSETHVPDFVYDQARQHFSETELVNLTLCVAAIDAWNRIAAWVKDLQQTHGAPSVKQQLAAVRMLFDWLITGQIVPMNPAATVRGPKHVVKIGKPPVLEGDEWRKLLASIPTTTLRDLRDRALIATPTYSFARTTAALKMKVEDLRPRGAGWTVRLHEKGGKEHAMPCHHALAEALRAYIDAAGIAEDRKGWLFRTARGHKADNLSDRAMNRSDAWCKIRRRAKSVATRFAPQGLPPISLTAARSSTPRKWRPTKARARPSFTTG
jgi:AhpD family alkylhydroperoxidase